jgi:hypothetical protein
VTHGAERAGWLGAGRRGRRGAGQAVARDGSGELGRAGDVWADEGVWAVANGEGTWVAGEAGAGGGEGRGELERAEGKVAGSWSGRG